MFLSAGSLFSVLDLRETALVRGQDSARGRSGEGMVAFEKAPPQPLLTCSMNSGKGEGLLSPEAFLLPG